MTKPKDGGDGLDTIRRMTERAMGNLTPKEREVLEQRFGKESGPELVASFERDRERIWQLEARALKKLRTLKEQAKPGLGASSRVVELLGDKGTGKGGKRGR